MKILLNDKKFNTCNIWYNNSLVRKWYNKYNSL